MSVIPAALTHESEEELVAESVPPRIDVPAPPAPGVFAEHNAVSSTAAEVLRQPTRRGIRATPIGAAATRPMLVDSPLDLHAPQHHPQDLGFLESARMEREIARETHQSSQPRSQKSAMSIPTALANMSTRSLFVLAVGVLLLTVALLALRFPVFLSDFDQWGFQINCGSGFQSTLTQAGVADSTGTHFVDQCHTAIAMRRAWTIPLGVAGALLLSALLVRPSSAAGTSSTCR
jgi:hypothetical protein